MNLKISDHDHDRYITTQQFNKLISENFSARLAQAHLASKNDIANFVKKTDLVDKKKTSSTKVTSNETRHILGGKELNELLEYVKAISTKELTKDLIKKFSIFNVSKFIQYLYQLKVH